MLVYDVLGDAAFQKLWQGFVELIINKSSSISEVLTTVLEFLKSLACEVSKFSIFDLPHFLGI